MGKKCEISTSIFENVKIFKIIGKLLFFSMLILFWDFVGSTFAQVFLFFMDKFEYLGILEFIMKEETEKLSEVPFNRHPSVRKSSKLLEKPSDHARGGFRSLDEKRPSF